MSLVLKDRVRETATVVGTGDAALLGAVTGFQSFSVVGNTNTCYYAISDQSGGDWEVGIGTYSTTGPTLARTTVLASSNSGSKVSFTGGTKDVFLTYPSERAVYLDASGNLNISGNVTLSGGTANGVAYLNGSKVLTTGSALTFDGTNFGVGTTSPQKKFVVSDSGNIGLELSPNDAGLGTGRLFAYNRTTSAYVPLMLQGSNVQFYTETSEGMRLTSTGLGIGTSNPQKKFVVSNAGAVSLEIDPLGRSGEAATSLLSYNRSTSAFVPAQYDASEHQFMTSTTEQMRLTSTGLGIGTSSPAYKLDVYGTPAATSGALAYLRDSSATGSNTTLGSIAFSSNPGTDFYIGKKSENTVGSLSFGNANTGAEFMRLDSSGNLGLGVTPSAWGGGSIPAIDIGTYAGISNNSGGGGGIGLYGNAYEYTTGNFKYKLSYYATLYRTYAGQHQFFTAPSGTAGNAISFTQAMTLDASGNLALGNTTTNHRALIYTAGATAGYLQIANGSTGVASTQGFRIGTPAAGNAELVTDGAMLFSTGNTERMRIDSSGNLLVGTTTLISGTEKMAVSGSIAYDYVSVFRNTNANPYGTLFKYSGASPNGTTNEFIVCTDSGPTTRMAVRSNGGIANYSANNVNLSDRREKTNFAPAKPYLETICSIPVQTFNYIDQNAEEDPGTTLGVIAQDVQAVAPELVMESNWGTKDDPKMRLSIYQTDLQYALMKCIQEQQELINQLTARVAQLEGN